MSTKFGKKGFYAFEVESTKNHIFLQPMGVWKTVDEDVPDYLKDLEKALSMVKRGFSLMVDLSEMAPPKLKVTSMLKENQKMIKSAGVAKTAVIVPEGQIMKKLSLTVVGNLSGLPMKVFTKREEAEAWVIAKEAPSKTDKRSS